MLGRTKTEFVTGYTVRRCEQFETFPGRSSKNCDLQFANADRQTYRQANYSIDGVKWDKMVVGRHDICCRFMPTIIPQSLLWLCLNY